MGNPGSSPPNGNPRQFTRQMGTPVNSPQTNGNPSQFTASRASMCCCAIFFAMNLTSWLACPHTYSYRYAHAHTLAFRNTHTHTHTHTHTLVNCHRSSLTSGVNGPHSPSHPCCCYLPATEREQGLCLRCNQQQQRQEGGHRPVLEM